MILEILNDNRNCFAYTLVGCCYCLSDLVLIITILIFSLFCHFSNFCFFESLYYFAINGQEVSDPEIMAAFPIVDDPEGTAFVAWTTTPWTLPSNLALCVNANFVYVKVS